MKKFTKLVKKKFGFLKRKDCKEWHCLAPPEGPGTRGTPRVNLGGQPQGSGRDSKAILTKKNFCDGRTAHGQTDTAIEIVI